MNPPEANRDDEPFASLLPSIEKDAVPPDEEFLARLRAQTTEAFVAAAAQPLPINDRKSRMFTHGLRWLGTAAAVLLFVGLGWYFWLGPGRSPDAFSKVLERVESAKTVHLRVKFPGDSRQI